MSRNGTKKSRTSQIPIFITKLYDMLEENQNRDIIGWTSTGDSFSIHSISRFTEQVLPTYFKHRNFASFIRQLNMYGFRKIRHTEGDNVYSNEHFKEGVKHLLRNITRKIREDKEEQVELYNKNSHIVDPNVNRQIQELRSNQKNLEELCRHFIEQNQRLLEENQSIVHRMEEEDKEKERKLEELLVFLLTHKDGRSLKNNPSEHLRLTNYEHPIKSEGEDTPLEAIGNSMDENQQLYRARQMIHNIYSRKQRKRDNYTVIDPQQEKKVKQQPPLSQVEQKVGNGEEEDKSFMSINDFLNVEDGENHHFDLESSV